jgi:hypothetical protein
MGASNDFEIHFNRMGRSGATLVVVAIGTDVYGATHAEPVTALRAAAHKAAVDLSLRGRLIDPHVVVQHGLCRLSGTGL